MIERALIKTLGFGAKEFVEKAIDKALEVHTTVVSLSLMAITRLGQLVRIFRSVYS